MAIGIERFRQATGDRLVLDNAGTGVQKSELGIGERLKNWWNGGPPAPQARENFQFKTAFFQALVKAEGPGIAQAAMRHGGLPATWATDGKPISARRVQMVLDEAQKIRHTVMNRNAGQVRGYMAGANGAPSAFAVAFGAAVGFAANQGVTLPANGHADPKLRAAFLREVRMDPQFSKGDWNAQKLDAVAQRAIQNYYTQKTAAFTEQHPGLTNYAQRNHAGRLPGDARSYFGVLASKLDPNTAAGHPLATEAPIFRGLARDALTAIEGTGAILRRMEWTPAGWDAQKNEIDDAEFRLSVLENNLDHEDELDTPEGQDLRQDLITELKHQQRLLQAKSAYLNEVIRADPLSQKSVGYSNRLWAEAAGHVFDAAIAYLNNNPPTDGTLNQRIQMLTTAKAQHIQDRTNAFNLATQAHFTNRADAPTSDNKKTHPSAMAKTDSVAFLKAELQRAGMPQSVIADLTSDRNVKDARRTALAQNPDWAPFSRGMLVTKDGVTRRYQSDITPGRDISPRFARRYADANPLVVGGPQHPVRAGISSAEKADHYHARNLKISTLSETPITVGPSRQIATVVGHGVLDMWEIPDATERQAANERGAHEVLEAAITTNDRIRNEALTRAQNNNPAPVRITHVSVNLVTPSPIREVPLGRTFAPDYQEMTYTDAQFRAFESKNGAQTFQLDDNRTPGVGIVPQGQDVNLNVEVDAITFSFAINPLATGANTGAAIGVGVAAGAVSGALAGTVLLPGIGTGIGAGIGAVGGLVAGVVAREEIKDAVLAGWNGVYEHNRANMVKFVGDLGSGGSGSIGMRPGGFIGSVMDRLDPNDPQQGDLARKIQEQTDIVRDLFLSEAFKNGDGDPAKMGREILVLQAYAEQALDMVGDTSQAATMSKGCKSDKDRGGVTDVELKHKLITEEMGGRIVPNRDLDGDDQENYYVVSASSGQLENQQLNTGLPGSKEAGKLKERIPSQDVRQYLQGQGALASE